MSLHVTESSDGVTFAVRVQPRARRNAVIGSKGDRLKACVTAPPEDGRANQAVIELLAETLGVKRRQVQIIAGATSRDKVVRITGMTRGELAMKLSS